MTASVLPVVIIGAGPVGLAAAVHVRARGLTPLVLEAGGGVGTWVQEWSHVHMFSPWAFNVDPLAAALLDRHGWRAPDPAAFPTGGQLVARYLEPLAALPELAPHVRTGARVTAVTRHGRDRMKDAGREGAPFLVRYRHAGEEHELLARSVLDASGTFGTPNPAGAAGIPALGERDARASVFYGMPDVLGLLRARYEGPASRAGGAGSGRPRCSPCESARGPRAR
jgi:cation diffusion facilitator CzcD-associated flavoprotein CzcO